MLSTCYLVWYESASGQKKWCTKHWRPLCLKLAQSLSVSWQTWKPRYCCLITVACFFYIPRWWPSEIDSCYFITAVEYVCSNVGCSLSLIQMLLKLFLTNFRSHSFTIQRSAAHCLLLTCQHSRKPATFTVWTLNVLLGNVRRWHSDRLWICCYLHSLLLPSVLWCCWLGSRKGIRPVKTEWWGTGMVSCLEWDANDVHMVQLMPLPPHPLLLK